AREISAPLRTRISPAVTASRRMRWFFSIKSPPGIFAAVLPPVSIGGMAGAIWRGMGIIIPCTAQKEKWRDPPAGIRRGVCHPRRPVARRIDRQDIGTGFSRRPFSQGPPWADFHAPGSLPPAVHHVIMEKTHPGVLFHANSSLDPAGRGDRDRAAAHRTL